MASQLCVQLEEQAYGYPNHLLQLMSLQTLLIFKVPFRSASDTSEIFLLELLVSWRSQKFHLFTLCWRIGCGRYSLPIWREIRRLSPSLSNFAKLAFPAFYEKAYNDCASLKRRFPSPSAGENWSKIPDTVSLQKYRKLCKMRITDVFI